MTTSSRTREPHKTYTNVIHESEVDGGWSGQLRVVRATGNSRQELVFVDSDLLGQMRLVLTREQAVDFAEAVHNASGMATSSYSAQFLAEAVRDGLARKGVSQARICATTGISKHRLRKILNAEVPMTHDEHVAISEVRA